MQDIFHWLLNCGCDSYLCTLYFSVPCMCQSNLDFDSQKLTFHGKPTSFVRLMFVVLACFSLGCSLSQLLCVVW